MRKPTKKEWAKQFSLLGHKKRWAERNRLIEELKSFGGHQPNFKSYSTTYLKQLLKWWKSIKI